MTIEIGTGTAGTRFLKRDYPHEEGLIAGTTKQEGTKPHLEAEEDLTEVNSRVGL